LIARPTGKRQVADAIRPTARPRYEMLDLERDILLVAVGAGSPPFMEQIFTHLIALE